MTDTNYKDNKHQELLMYRDLILATIDYYLENNLMGIKNETYDPENYLRKLKTDTEEHFKKGRLTRLKQWFRDLTEMQIETGDLKFNKYLRDKTNYDIDIFKSHFQRIDKIIAKGKITTDNQFYDVNIMVDHLSQVEPVDVGRIEILNKLLADYEQRRARKRNS